jgi:hypothetical protein
VRPALERASRTSRAASSGVDINHMRANQLSDPAPAQPGSDPMGCEPRPSRPLRFQALEAADCSSSPVRPAISLPCPLASVERALPPVRRSPGSEGRRDPSFKLPSRHAEVTGGGMACASQGSLGLSSPGC